MDQTVRNAIFYSTIIAIGGFVFGFDASVISGVVGHVQTQFDLDAGQIGLLVGAPTFAAIISSFSIGFISDIIGRKKILLILAALYLISAVLSAIAWDFISLVIARAIGGYAFGALTQAPVYIAEISPARIRGRMVAINQMTIVVGLSTAYFTNFAIQSIAQSSPSWATDLGIVAEPWRWMLGLEIIVAALWFLSLFLVPPSPRWLATKGRWDEASLVLKKVVPATELEVAIADMRSQMGEALSQNVSRLNDLFSNKVRFALMIGLIIAVVQMITGINTVFFYATTIFELSGAGTNAAFMQAILVGLINILFTIISMVLIDRLGRRPLMIFGLIGVSVSLSCVAFGFISANYVLTEADLATIPQLPELAALKDVVFTNDVNFKAAITNVIGSDALRDNSANILKAGLEGQPVLILGGILGFVASFAFSLGPVMWVFLSEIYPNRIRGIVISLLTVFNSGASFLVNFTFPTQTAAFGIASVFAMYAAFAFIGLALVYWLMPETKGLSLEQIEEKMAKGINAK